MPYVRDKGKTNRKIPLPKPVKIPAPARNYFVDEHGAVRHLKPKRPNGMTHRQWKKMYMDLRRQAKARSANNQVAA